MPELALIAVHAEHRTSGIGRRLVESVEKSIQNDGCRFLEVHTVGPSYQDEGYAATRAFFGLGIGADLGSEHRMGTALGQRHDPGLREGRLLALVHPGRPKCSALTVVSATSRHMPSIATSRRPASHTPGVWSVPIGLATRSNNAVSGSVPSRARAWKIADLLGGE